MYTTEWTERKLMYKKVLLLIEYIIFQEKAN